MAKKKTAKKKTNRKQSNDCSNNTEGNQQERQPQYSIPEIGGESTTTTASSSLSSLKDPSDLHWLKDCDRLKDSKGQSWLQLEYRSGDCIMERLSLFFEHVSPQAQVVDQVYQIWQHSVISTLLDMSALWQKDHVTPELQRQMKDQLKLTRYKISFVLHHVLGRMLNEWMDLRDHLLQVCFQTLHLLPRLAESCPHSKTDVRQVIIYFEAKEFLASVACETWDTLYDNSIPLDPTIFVPILRRCAMLDILDKDWNMLGGWEDILKGLEARCFCGDDRDPTAATTTTTPVFRRLPTDAVLQETTTVLRNARNSMQCKFFSVRFMRYTEDQAPQRWRYFPKCSAPACFNLESPQKPHTLRCTSCWYFHYCSDACQEYCDAIMGLHPKFCQDTPPGKARLCRQETLEFLQQPLDDDDGDNTNRRKIKCKACGCLEEHNSEGGGMKRCSQCQRVYYCSRQCQEWDWRSGGHRQMCKELVEGVGETSTPK